MVAAVCVAVTVGYWALALPVALAVFFGLGLTFWVGYTIATIKVEPYEDAPPRQ